MDYTDAPAITDSADGETVVVVAGRPCHAVRIRAVPDPGAGNAAITQWARKVRIATVTAHFVASAAVATRTLVATIKDADGNVIGAFPVDIATTAGKTHDATWARGNVLPGAANRPAGGLPDLLLPADCSLTVTADNIDAGDALTSCIVTYEPTPE